MSCTVIGFSKTSFTPNDSKEPISGYNIYLVEPVDPKKGEGMTAERIFMTTDKLLACGYNPQLNDDVKVEYNKYGKPAGIYFAET